MSDSDEGDEAQLWVGRVDGGGARSKAIILVPVQILRLRTSNDAGADRA